MRRLTLATMLGVDHSFLYQFSGDDNWQSITDFNRVPRLSFYATNRFYDIMGGLALNSPATLSYPTRTSIRSIAKATSFPTQEPLIG
jgi:hypothetical protein